MLFRSYFRKRTFVDRHTFCRFLLARALPEEDEEGLEMSASLCAADASLVLLAEPSADGAADRRIVIAADVDAEAVRELAVGPDALPGTVELLGPVSWDDVAALLVDEERAETDVRLENFLKADRAAEAILPPRCPEKQRDRKSVV